MRKHILLIDDNPIQLRTMKELLKENYDVSMALSVAESLEIIVKNKPDLIFLDYDMPNMNGKEAFEKMKNIEYCNDIPVVFLTGVDDAKNIKEVLELRPAGYLLKPASIKRINDILDRLLGPVQKRSIY